jgi:hypothetical protein
VSGPSLPSCLVVDVCDFSDIQHVQYLICTPQSLPKHLNSTRFIVLQFYCTTHTPTFDDLVAYLLSKSLPRLARYWIWHTLCVAQASMSRSWILFVLCVCVVRPSSTTNCFQYCWFIAGRVLVRFLQAAMDANTTDQITTLRTELDFFE